MMRSFMVFLFFIALASEAWAFTANKVWFEFRPRGRYRVTVNYTVPALKEFRESYVDFKDKKEAEKFYWALVRGADFFPADAGKFKFVTQPPAGEPW